MSKSHPKPIGSVGRYSLGKGKPTRKAIIHVNVWKVGAWTYHQEEKVKFRNLADARSWASKHGFDGIKVEIE